MDGFKELVETLLVANVVDIALRLEPAGTSGSGRGLSEEAIARAVALVQSHRSSILADLKSDAQGSAKAAVDDEPGSEANLEKARRMSMKQKRYDLGKGLY